MKEQPKMDTTTTDTDIVIDYWREVIAWHKRYDELTARIGVSEIGRTRAEQAEDDAMFATYPPAPPFAGAVDIFSSDGIGKGDMIPVIKEIIAAWDSRPIA